MARRVFLLFACLYVLSIGAGFYSSDGEVMFRTTAALVERGTLALEPDLPQIVRGYDGRFYSKYDPGLPLVGVPFYVTGDQLGAINQAHRYRLAAIFYLLIPALAAAGTVAALVSLAGRLFPARRALMVALIAGLATMLWPYARVLFAESVLALALTAAVGMIVRFHGHRKALPHPSIFSPTRLRGRQFWGVSFESRFCREGFANPPWASFQTRPYDFLVYKPAPTKLPSCQPMRRGEANHRFCPPRRLERGTGGEVSLQMLFAGPIFGLGVLTRAALIIYLLPLVLLILRITPGWKCRVLRVGAFAAGLSPFVVILLWHNAIRFDDPLQFGYGEEGFTTPLWEGIPGLLFSPGKSIFLYAPPLILSLILWPRFRRDHPALGDFLALAWITALAFYGAWWAWHGGWCWGPRFLLPLIPLSCLPLGEITCFAPLADCRCGANRAGRWRAASRRAHGCESALQRGRGRR